MRAAFAAAGALALAVWQLACAPGSAPISRDTVAAEAGKVRPVEGRVAGVPYAPWRRPGAERKRMGVKRTQLLARRIRPLLGWHASHNDLAAWGCLLLLAGERAAPALERAVAAGAGNAKVLNDLGVAYLDQASAADPRGYLLALERFEEAVALCHSCAPPQFNRALALERLALTRAARAAWRTYLEADATSEWAGEALRHLAWLAVPTDPELWHQSLPVLATAAGAGAPPVLAMTAVSRTPQEARQDAEQRLLPTWAAGVAPNGVESPPAREALAEVRLVGAALAASSGDAMLRDTVAAIDRARQIGKNDVAASLAEGHAAYAVGLSGERASDYRKAAAAFARARAALGRGGSPFADWAAFQLTHCRYQRSQFSRALALLGEIRARIATRNYPVLAGRVEWLTATIELIGGRPGEALGGYGAARSRFQRAAEVDNLCAVEALMAVTLDSLGDAMAAWQHRYQALAALARLDDPVRFPTSTQNHPALRRGRIYPTTLETGKKLRDAREIERASTSGYLPAVSSATMR